MRTKGVLSRPVDASNVKDGKDVRTVGHAGARRAPADAIMYGKRTSQVSCTKPRRGRRSVRLALPIVA
jgi:hypothetical protein